MRSVGRPASALLALLAMSVAARLVAERLAGAAPEPSADAQDASAGAAAPSGGFPTRARPRRAARRECTVEPTADMSDEAPTAAVGVAAEAAAVPATRVLRLLDERGEPLEGVWARCGDTSGFTNARGEVEFPVKIGGGANDRADDRANDRADDRADGMPATATYESWPQDRSVALEGAVTEVVLSGLARLDVRIVDGATGAELPAVSWTAASRSWANGRSRDAAPLPLVPDDRGTATATVSADPPPGYGAVRDANWKGPVASTARTVRVVVPVWPARELRLRAVDPTGSPVAGISGTDVGVRLPEDGDEDVTFHSATSGADGLLTLSGVPRIPGVTYSVSVAGDVATDVDKVWRGELAGIGLDAAGDAAVRDIVVRESDRRFAGRGAIGSVGCCGGCGTRRPRETASVRIRVFRADGTPAAHVSVRGASVSGRTDADGALAFESAARGPADFVAVAHGYTPTVVSAEVGVDAEVEIREAPTRDVTVSVVDEDGRPVPAALVLATCARIPGRSGASVSVGCTVAQFADDDRSVELATPHTGPDGTVVLAAPAGEMRYEVTWGALTASAASDGDRVTVVLPCARR